MKKFLLFFIIMSSMLFGAYDIKIGVFKNGKNLRQQIAKVKPYVFRKQIIIEKKNNLYYAYAIIFGSGTQAAKALESYQHIFQDAFIAGKVKKRQIKRKTNITKTAKKKSLKKRKLLFSPKKQEEVLDASGLLLGKSIYLCYDDGPTHLNKRIVQMTFNEKVILYKSLENKSIQEIPYKLEKENIIFTVSNMQMIHKLKQNKDRYLLVQSFIGIKKMHTLRYYYSIKDAIEFLKKK